MENEKISIAVHFELKDGRYHITIDTMKGMSLVTVQSMLVGALNLTIRGEETPERQAQTLRQIVRFMENELINGNSFEDAKFPILGTQKLNT